MAVSNKTNDYKPGDLVTCIVPPNVPHIMIVSDKEVYQGTLWSFTISAQAPERKIGYSNSNIRPLQNQVGG